MSNKGEVKIVSYINNLHSIEYNEFYGVIEQIIQRFILLFNKVLTDLFHSRNKRNQIPVYGSSTWYGNDYEIKFDSECDDDDNIDRLFKIPDVEEFEMPPSDPTYDGDRWQVEGIENEHIVATGVYYYHSSNLE